MIEIVNASTSSKAGVYVGRSMPRFPRGSVLGNPYKIGKDGDRDEVIEKYKVWLRTQYRKGGAVKIELDMLARKVKAGQDIVLVCWCYPQRCHAEFIREAIEKLSIRI